MREAVIHKAPPESAGFDGQHRPAKDKFVRRKFSAVAKVLWEKPDVAIADIEGCDPRTGRRILRGEAEVSWRVLLAACVEMMKPLD